MTEDILDKGDEPLYSAASRSPMAPLPDLRSKLYTTSAIVL
jgi:hypothetical protein